ncbi:hypothetical protein KHQ81_15720 (plasmid) [Mycoplasmatota bacterium]|nr:hypothetical protein KHQ81_15720 [Mycoplasmatota bacterium]
MATTINTTIEIQNYKQLNKLQFILDECKQYLGYEVKEDDNTLTIWLKQSFNESKKLEAFFLSYYKTTDNDFDIKCNYYWNQDGTAKSENIQYINLNGNKIIIENRDINYLDDIESKYFNYEIKNNILTLIDYKISISINEHGNIMPSHKWLELSKIIGEEKIDEVYHIIKNYREKNRGTSEQGKVMYSPLTEMDLPF